jgi:hypothetical protein
MFNDGELTQDALVEQLELQYKNNILEIASLLLSLNCSEQINERVIMYRLQDKAMFHAIRHTLLNTNTEYKGIHVRSAVGEVILATFICEFKFFPQIVLPPLFHVHLSPLSTSCSIAQYCAIMQ